MSAKNIIIIIIIYFGLFGNDSLIYFYVVLKYIYIYTYIYIYIYIYIQGVS